jgi:hypothetical protein
MWANLASPRSFSPSSHVPQSAKLLSDITAKTSLQRFKRNRWCRMLCRKYWILHCSIGSWLHVDSPQSIDVLVFTISRRFENSLLFHCAHPLSFGDCQCGPSDMPRIASSRPPTDFKNVFIPLAERRDKGLEETIQSCRQARVVISIIFITTIQWIQ